MERSSQAALRLTEIDAMQDEILRQLEALERRTEAVLAEHAPHWPPAVAAAMPAPAPDATPAAGTALPAGSLRAV